MPRPRGNWAVPCAAVATLALVHFFVPVPEVMLSEGRYLARAALHPFFHAGVLHLCANSLCALRLWSLLPPRRLLPLIGLSWLVAAAVYWCASKPVIGISNMLCATVGWLAPPLRGKGSEWWRRPATLASLGGTLLIGLLPAVSGATHLASLALAFLLRRGRDALKDAYADYKRTDHR